MTPTRRRFIIVTYAGAIAIIAVDQMTKRWISDAEAAGRLPIVLVPDVLELIFRLNTGMAFSLLVNAPQLLTVVAAAASVALSVVIWRLKRPGLWSNLALACLLGGAVGNLIDRLRIGAVIDFVYFKPINFPAFNVADSALTVGVILAAWAMWRASGDEAATAQAESAGYSGGSRPGEER